jgi:glycosyltransferase involved in cell wall biosynthesis
VLIKELHNNFGFSKKINFETILRFFMSSKVLVYLVLKLVDTMYSRSRYISNYWKIKYVPQYVYIKPLNTRLDKNINRICYLGHPMRKKGVYLFPELLTRLKNTNRDDVSFSFALSNLGDRPKITKQISEAAYGSDIKVSFLNEVEPSRFFRDNSIFVLPSVDEHSATSVPNTILESMEAGCVVITSKNNITSGVIKNGYSGILLDKMDSESLLLSINSLVSSKKAYSKISSNSRKYIEVNHDLRYIRKCFKEIYGK